MPPARRNSELGSEEFIGSARACLPSEVNFMILTPCDPINLTWSDDTLIVESARHGGRNLAGTRTHSLPIGTISVDLTEITVSVTDRSVAQQSIISR